LIQVSLKRPAAAPVAKQPVRSSMCKTVVYFGINKKLTISAAPICSYISRCETNSIFATVILLKQWKVSNTFHYYKNTNKGTFY
jgi:hypothetical protein